MKKTEFMKLLKQNIATLKESERNEILEYYEEIILDKMESGMSEQEVLEELGSPETVAKKILKESKIKEDSEAVAVASSVSDENRAVRIILFCLCLPLTLPLFCAAFILLLSFWIVIVSLFFASGVLGLAAVIYIPLSLILMFQYLGNGIVQIGVCCFLLGLAILLYIGTYALMKQVIKLTKYMVTSVPQIFKGVFQ